ncbi:MAG: PilZ domain-containing protein [Oxalobacteraceae bacterium]|nr:MAG: PilZ domain-containing protein [Oxalobacteraceae bacterium]
MSAISVRSRRHPTSKAGVISHGGWMAGCTVVDVSVSGARLQVPGSVTVPDQFELSTDLSGSSRRCRTVWREDGQVGVEFVEWT